MRALKSGTMKQKNNRNIGVIRRNFGKATRVLALIALGSLVLYFVRDSVNKFYSKKTATTIDILPLPEVKFPYVSLCPGFKEEELKKMEAELRDTLAAAKARKDGLGDTAAASMPDQ